MHNLQPWEKHYYAMRNADRYSFSNIVDRIGQAVKAFFTFIAETFSSLWNYCSSKIAPQAIQEMENTRSGGYTLVINQNITMEELSDYAERESHAIVKMPQGTLHFDEVSDLKVRVKEISKEMAEVIVKINPQNLDVSGCNMSASVREKLKEVKYTSLRLAYTDSA